MAVKMTPLLPGQYLLYWKTDRIPSEILNLTYSCSSASMSEDLSDGKLLGEKEIGKLF